MSYVMHIHTSVYVCVCLNFNVCVNLCVICILICASFACRDACDVLPFKWGRPC